MDPFFRRRPADHNPIPPTSDTFQFVAAVCDRRCLSFPHVPAVADRRYISSNFFHPRPHPDTLSPRMLKAAIVGLPNVGKSARIDVD